MGEAMDDRLRALSAYLQQRGVQPAGAPFVRYHTFGETETDLETGIPVAEPVAGEGRIVSGVLPGGPAISTQHIGLHDRLGDAYACIDGCYHKLERQLSEHKKMHRNRKHPDEQKQPRSPKS